MDYGDIDMMGDLDMNIVGQAQGDILYFNGTTWVRLPAGTANQALRTNGAGANPAWENVDNATNLSISGQAQGDILYFNGTNWVRLPAGTAGQVLKTQGAGANPLYGLAQDLQIASQSTGSLLYFNGTNWIRLAPGTAGQLLQTNGAAAPTWITPASSGPTLEQNATFNTSSQVIVTVPITTNKNYKMYWEFKQTTAGVSSDLGFEFNASTAATYHWNKRRLHTVTTGTGTGHSDPDSVTTEWTSRLTQTKFRPWGDTAITTGEEVRLSMEFMTHTGLNAMLKGWFHKTNDPSEIADFYGTGPTLTTSIRLTQAIGGPFFNYEGEYWLWSLT